MAEGLSVRAVEEIVTLGGVTPGQGAPGSAAGSPRSRARLADRLSDAFDTRVKVELGQRKGKIVVEFATLEDLERIVRAMAPS